MARDSVNVSTPFMLYCRALCYCIIEPSYSDSQPLHFGAAYSARPTGIHTHTHMCACASTYTCVQVLRVYVHACAYGHVGSFVVCCVRVCACECRCERACAGDPKPPACGPRRLESKRKRVRSRCSDAYPRASKRSASKEEPALSRPFRATIKTHCRCSCMSLRGAKSQVINGVQTGGSRRRCRFRLRRFLFVFSRFNAARLKGRIRKIAERGSLFLADRGTFAFANVSMFSLRRWSRRYLLSVDLLPVEQTNKRANERTIELATRRVIPILDIYDARRTPFFENLTRSRREPIGLQLYNVDEIALIYYFCNARCVAVSLELKYTPALLLRDASHM